MRAWCFVLMFLSINVYSQEESVPPIEELTKEEQKILDEYRRGEIAKEENKNPNKKKSFNDNMKINRGDNRIVEEILTPGDALLIKTCHANQVRVSFPSDTSDVIFQVAIGNPEIFGVVESDAHPNSKIFHLKKPVEGTVYSPIWIFRSSDKRPYVINAIGEPCPEEGLLPYPMDITIREHESVSFVGKRPRLLNKPLIPTDFLAEIARGTVRKNDINNINLNGVIGGGTSKTTILSVSIPLTSHVSYPFKGLKKLKIQEPEFIVINKLMTRQIQAEQTYLSHSSQLETDKNGFPTIRFSLSIGIDKKKIYEDENIYLMVLYPDLNVHQMVEVNLKKMLEQFSKSGGEI